ncbi:MAG: response regulator [Candidatus Marinimicrobia bacterium]|nr:response regulator [Candidatus Neomarinimicrobiota bacterium]
MTIFLATFFYHRFWREQYVLNILAIFGLIGLTLLRSEIVTDSILLIIFHLLTAVLAFFFRRQFVGGMYIVNLKQSREELQAAKEQAEESDKMKSVFLSTMSHEVRTPLNVILGYIEILQMSMEQGITNEQKEFISLINVGSTRLMRLMDDILDISRIEAGKIVLQEEVLIGDYVVERAVSEITGEARQKNMRVIEKYNCPKNKIFADAIRLQQVLVNILGNAVKFTDQGSITITTSKSANEFRVDIQDTGIGIGDSFKPYLFTLFKQAEEGFSRSYEGLGLGLTISQRLIQSMKGRIEVESKPNQGSKFTIILPLYKLEGDYSQPKTKKERSDNKKVTNVMNNKKKALKLLVLEDNPANMKYMEYLLKRLGVEFISIESGVKALAQIDQINPDGMLIDISLSEEMDGVEFLKNVRKQDKYNKIPAIAVTAHTMKGMQEQFLTQGFNDYLSKPYTIKGLAEIIDRNFVKSTQS